MNVIAPVVNDSTFCSDGTQNSDLATFLSRPVLIGTIAWAEAGTVNVAYNIWKDFFDNSIIKNKIENYAFINCKLKVKVQINASPFYYGALLVSYTPLQNWTSFTASMTSDEENVLRSQRPHFYIYPQCCQGGEIELPFFYHENWLDLTSNSDVEDMGVLEFNSITPLANANSVAGTDIDIKVYCWAEDVKLAGSTAKAVLQSGKDEYEKTGMISGPASAVAQAASSLSAIPLISPYMRATEVVASAVSGVAKYFGFTNTPVIDDVMPMKNLPFHSFASSEIGQPLEKLALDPKNELSIDPRTVGLDGKDELLIKNIVCRESYLETFDWLATDAVGHQIFGCDVTPGLFRYTNPINYPTPMAHVADMFKYWRGSIIIRVRFLCSQYHRGRAIISWDPVADIGFTQNDLATSYNQIIDISENADVEFTVPYLQATPWLLTDHENFTTERFAATYSNNGTDYANGLLVIRVMTQQTSPVASATIQCMVSVRAGEDFELAVPTDLTPLVSYYPLGGGEDALTGENIDMSNATLQSGTMMYEEPTEVLFGDTIPTFESNIYNVNFGERIVSLRTLLRRTSLSRVSYFDNNTTANCIIWRSLFRRLPLYNGYDANGINASTGPIPYNYVYNHPMNWVGACFIGLRGAVHWAVDVELPQPYTIAVRRSDDTLAAAEYVSALALAVNSLNSVPDFYIDSETSGATGMSVLNQHTQTGLTFSAPMYSNHRMQSCAPNDRTIGVAADQSTTDGFKVSVKAAPSNNVTGQIATTVAFYCSIGTDFNYHFFLSAPRLYVLPIPAI